MQLVVKRIADFFISKSIINKSEREVIEYGLFLIINDVISFSSIIIISWLLDTPRFAFEFLMVFCLTRIFCGGYHAKKAYICKLSMILTFIAIYYILPLHFDS